MKEKYPTVKTLLEKQVWGSGGAPDSHGTWGLTLYNNKYKNGLQKQGTYVHSTSDLDPATNVSHIRDAAMGSPLQVSNANII